MKTLIMSIFRQYFINITESNQKPQIFNQGQVKLFLIEMWPRLLSWLSQSKTKNAKQFGIVRIGNYLYNLPIHCCSL